MSGIAILFPGQGSQCAGMGKRLYDSFDIVKDIFEEANETLGFDIKKMCFEGSIDELTQTENTQPAILTVSFAAFKVFMRECNITPRYLAGHSLGEISALTCAGAINFSDALKIVRARGKFMQETVPINAGSMAAVSNLSIREIEEICFEYSDSNTVVVSNYNSPSQTVISGHNNLVEKVSDIFKGKGANVVPLKVSAPFHSYLMNKAASMLRSELAKYSYKDIQYPVLSNVTAKPYPNVSSIEEFLYNQIISPVRWTDILDYLLSNEITAFIEMDPGKVLSRIIKKDYTEYSPVVFNSENDHTAINEYCSNYDTELETKAIRFKFMTRCLAIAVCTKNSNWDEANYQKGVVEPYREIHNLVLDMEKEERTPTLGEVGMAIDMLKSVFKTKITPEDEQEERFNQLFNETGLKACFKS